MARFTYVLLALTLLPILSAGQTKPAPASSRPAAAPKPAPVPIGQRQPTRDRYIEIQKALADAGHFSGRPDGVWGKSSIAALQAFQESVGLEPTGRIDALSLIRLGLGPRYEQPPEPAEAAAILPR